MTDAKVAAFHIGAHKTGTSVLQRYLNDHGDVLERNRVELITRSELSEYVGWGVRLIEDRELLRRRIDRMRRNPKRIGIFGSNENIVGRPFPDRGDGRLYPHAARNIQALADAIEPARPKIFLSVRPQHEFIESYYLQTIHQGGHEPFRGWLKRVDLKGLSWRPLVNALIDSVGVQGFEIVDFRIIRQGQEAYIRHFLTRLIPGFDEAVEYPVPQNRSVSERGLQIAMAVNPLLRPEERNAMRRFLQRNFSNIDQPRPVLLQEEERLELEEQYGSEYEELISTYGRPPAGSIGAEDRASAG